MQNTNDPPSFNPARPKEIGPDYGRGSFQGGSRATRESSTQSFPGQGPSSSQGLGDQAMSAGRDMAERAQDAASETVDALRTQAADLASQGRDKIMEKAQDQKRAGAEYLSGIAESIRRAAREFDQVPFAANYIRTAASGVDNVAETVRNGDFSELITETQNFARRQPTLFVGLSMLAGFGVTRLLKGAAAPMISGSGQSSLTGSPADAGRASGPGLGGTDEPGTIDHGAASDSGARQPAGGDNVLGM